MSAELPEDERRRIMAMLGPCERCGGTGEIVDCEYAHARSCPCCANGSPLCMHARCSVDRFRSCKACGACGSGLAPVGYDSRGWTAWACPNGCKAPSV